MALKDLLVVVDGSPAAAARIDAAALLAERHQAHLTGLAVISPLLLPGSLEAQLSADIYTLQRQADEERARQLRALFDQRVALAGLTERSEFRLAEGDPTGVAADHARYADLVVVGQSDPQAPLGTAAVDPETLIFGSGRPVLVVPYSGTVSALGQRVLVAWNGSRESARALADAMVILERALAVTVLAVNPEPVTRGEDPAEDITRHLAHHGVRAEAVNLVTDPETVGDTLLNQITDQGADLVVMGAYGRSRWRSFILGSLTGYMLRHMTKPILFSH